MPADTKSKTKRQGTYYPLPKLSRLRLAQFMTQQELADKADVSRTTIYQLEAGNGRATSNTVKKLAEALGISREELVES